MTSTVFQLPAELAGKTDPALIADDDRLLSRVAESLADEVADVTRRLAEERRSPGRHGEQALARDLRIHHLTERLARLRRFGPDVCLGYFITAQAPVPVLIGRTGISDGQGRPLVLDWRSPAAEPFFAATPADPHGLLRRRRYRWSRGRIVDYWDEVFDPDAVVDERTLDPDAALLRSLSQSRTGRMPEVLSTLQADQDAIVRAPAAGALVVDGGPGTGKTVVALHRAAFLLYSAIRPGSGGALVVGPHRTYLNHVAEVLPGLGEDSVLLCTPADLVPGSENLAQETDPTVAALKATARVVDAVSAAVAFHEQPPAAPMVVETEWADLTVTAADFSRAFAVVDPGTPHNQARPAIWEELIGILLRRHQGGPNPARVTAALKGNAGLRAALRRAWPLVEPADLVADLWSVPAYLARCAPWWTADERARLHRPAGAPMTTADLPWLDIARHLLGDARAAEAAQQRRAVMAAERATRAAVIDDLIAADLDRDGVVTMLHGQDFTELLLDQGALAEVEAERTAGPFAHIVVDEAQELTDAQWQMLRMRCPTGSFTIVGDRAQARNGFTESWEERLQRVGIGRITRRELTLNYRTPAEIMAVAEPVIRAALPDANVPASIRSTGVRVRYGPVTALAEVVREWRRTHASGVACVIGADGFAGDERVRALGPAEAKGLEFDLVVLVRPEALGDGVAGAVDRYVAMTRATGELVILAG